MKNLSKTGTFISEPLPSLEEALASLQETLKAAVRRTSILRQVFYPQAITIAELDRQLSDVPAIIVEKMLGVEAASITLRGGEIEIFSGPRYQVTFEHICSDMTFERYIGGPAEETYGFLSHQENLRLFQLTKAICMRTGQMISGGGKTLEELTKIVEDNPSISTVVAAADVFDDLNLKEAVWPRPINVIRDEVAFGKGTVGFYPPRHLAGSVYILRDAYIHISESEKGLEVRQCETLGVGIDDIKSMWMVQFDD